MSEFILIIIAIAFTGVNALILLGCLLSLLICNKQYTEIQKDKAQDTRYARLNGGKK